MLPDDELSDEAAPTKSIVNRGKLPDMTALTMQSVSVGTLSLGADAASTTTSQRGQRAQYELIEIAGRGGMGEVFSAIQTSLGRVVAVKRLRAVESGESDQDRAMREALFRQEAVTAGFLEHPNILPVHDLGADELGSPLLAMKLVEGRPWHKIMKEDWGALSVDDFLSKHLPILIDVAQAVAYAHSRGIVHRDLKPAQVMVGSFGEVLLTDWGLAVHVGHEAESSQRSVLRARLAVLPSRESASNPSGTPALMAPEQTANTALSIGTWTDIFLLGGTLYFLLTGTYPHIAETRAATLALAERAEIVPPRTRASGREVPEELERLCLHCLQRDPRDRIATVGHFVKALQDFLSGAGRRRESELLTTAIAAKAAQPDLGYVDYAEALAKLSDARALWPGNPAEPELRQRLYAGYARCALRNGDLVLADSQTAAMAAGADRDAIRADVQKAERAVRRREQQRQVALVAILALFGIVAYLGGSAYREKVVAQAARERAEDMMSFMLTDLKEGLTPIGRVSLMEGVVTKAREYFRDQPAGLQSERSAMQQAALLEQVGDVYQRLGRREEAFEAYRDSIEQRRQILADQPDDKERRLALASGLYRMGAAHMHGDERVPADRILGEAESLLRGLLREDPESEPVNRVLAELLDYRATSIATLIDLEVGSPDAARESLAIRERFAARFPDDFYWNRNLIVSFEKVMISTTASGSPQRRQMVAERLARAEDLVRRFPDNTTALVDLAIAQNQFASQQPTPLDRAEPYERAAESFRRLVESDPANRMWRDEALVNTLGMMENYLAMKRPKRAIALAEQALADAREGVVSGLRGESVGETRLLAALMLSAQVYVADGLNEKAAPLMKEAFELSDEILKRNSLNVEAAIYRIEGLLLQAQMAKNSGDPAEYARTLRAVVEFGAAASDKFPGLKNIELPVVVAHKELTLVAWEASNNEAALRHIRGVFQHTRRMIDGSPDHTPALVDYLTSSQMISDALQDMGDTSGTLAILEEARQFAERCVSTGRMTQTADVHLAGHLRKYAARSDSVGMTDQARRLSEEGLSIVNRVLESNPDRMDAKREKFFLLAGVGELRAALRVADELAESGDADEDVLEFRRQLRIDIADPETIDRSGS